MEFRAHTRDAPNGMVCSVDHLASSAGVAVLRAGGTAVDAAIATSAVLAVTTQHMCGLGGDLFAIVHRADRPGPPEVLNASGRAGSGADPARLRADGHTAMPFRGDIRAVPVPGCVDGWLALHTRYGQLPLADVLAPAIGYARDGFPASPLLAATVPSILDVDGADDYRPSGLGRPLHAGDVVRREGVARTLEAIVAQGRDAFYGGEFGEELLGVGHGEYTPADLERIHADWVEPLGVRVWDHDVWTVPPNSQGYLTLAGAAIAEGLPLPAGRSGAGSPDDAAWAHLLVEAARQAGHDRIDMLHEGADGAALVASDRLAARRAAIDPEHRSAVTGNGAAGGTIFLCAVDRDRTGVSLIQSNAAGFGAHLAVPGLRIFLQNRGIGFSLEPGHPAEYGPGRRPPHTLAPALVTRPDGSLRLVLGTMGGDSQPQVLLQLLARLLFHGTSTGSAISAPRWALTSATPSGFDTWREPDGVHVLVEDAAEARWAQGLRDRGHPVLVASGVTGAFGHAHAIEVSASGEVLSGAADPRALIGAAAAY